MRLLTGENNRFLELKNDLGIFWARQDKINEQKFDFSRNTTRGVKCFYLTPL